MANITSVFLFFFRNISYQYMWKTSPLSFFFGLFYISTGGKHHFFIFILICFYFFFGIFYISTCRELAFCFFHYFSYQCMGQTPLIYSSGIFHISTCGKHHFFIFFLFIYFLVYFLPVHVANTTSLFFRYFYISTCGKHLLFNFFGIFFISTCGKHHFFIFFWYILYHYM